MARTWLVGASPPFGTRKPSLMKHLDGKAAGSSEVEGPSPVHVLGLTGLHSCRLQPIVDAAGRRFCQVGARYAQSGSARVTCSSISDARLASADPQTIKPRARSLSWSCATS